MPISGLDVVLTLIVGLICLESGFTCGKNSNAAARAINSMAITLFAVVLVVGALMTWLGLYGFALMTVIGAGWLLGFAFGKSKGSASR